MTVLGLVDSLESLEHLRNLCALTNCLIRMVHQLPLHPQLDYQVSFEKETLDLLIHIKPNSINPYD